MQDQESFQVVGWLLKLPELKARATVWGHGSEDGFVRSIHTDQANWCGTPPSSFALGDRTAVGNDAAPLKQCMLKRFDEISILAVQVFRYEGARPLKLETLPACVGGSLFGHNVVVVTAARLPTHDEQGVAGARLKRPFVACSGFRRGQEDVYLVHGGQTPAGHASVASKAATDTGRLTATALRSALKRSISCMVCAVNYDAPQRKQDYMGMPSMTSSAAPLPKLRVTYLRWGGDPPPQCAH